MAKQVIGHAAVKPDGLVFYRVRATPSDEDDAPADLVGDDVDEVPLDVFLGFGFELSGPLQNPGDRAEILAVE